MDCDVTCQKADFPVHRHWCKALADARDCQRCEQIARSFGGDNVVVLHGKMVKSQESETCVDQLVCQDPHYVVVEHAPFQGKFRKHARDIRAKLLNVDTIIQTGKKRHFLNWAKTSETLHLALSRDPECVVCLENSRIKHTCAVCKSPVCETCLFKLMGFRANSVPCPVCRGSFFSD